jgi:hypothetical protein
LIFFVSLVYLNQEDEMKYLIACLVVLSIVSCSPFGFNSEGYAKQESDFYSAWVITASYQYIGETKGVQYWKSPKQFESDGGGDCEDFTGHLMYYAGEGEAVLVSYQENGETICHCIMKYRGRYLEPQTVGTYYDIDAMGWKIIDTYSWNDYMAKITDFGTRDL